MRPRERLLLAAALLAALLFVIDALWFHPALRAFGKPANSTARLSPRCRPHQTEQALPRAGGADPAQQVEQEIRARRTA